MQRYIISKEKVKGDMHVIFRNGKEFVKIEVNELDIVEMLEQTMDRSELVAQTEAEFSWDLSERELAQMLVDMYGWESEVEAFVNWLTDAEVTGLERVPTKVVHLSKSKAA